MNTEEQQRDGCQCLRIVTGPDRVTDRGVLNWNGSNGNDGLGAETGAVPAGSEVSTARLG